MNKIKYVQFSKKIVVAVTICVTAICLSALIIMYLSLNIDSMTSVVRAYIDYAMVVFASYSANSISLKIVLQKFKSDNDDELAEG